jgi:hypothetical protein
MWFRWLPWKTLIKYVASKEGFMDPFSVLANVSRFGKPSEVLVPTELMRSAFVLHARGLINSQAIQHNLDWVWPYWVVKQFNPNDASFIPRAFSLTHINLTQRNWTAVGSPNFKEMPIVDPRGLVTPFYDGWSIDAWIVAKDKALLPSKTDSCCQTISTEGNLEVTTETQNKDLKIISKVSLDKGKNQYICRLKLKAYSDVDAWLAVSARPHNPEGISFIDRIKLLENNMGWQINDKDKVFFSCRPNEYKFSDYSRGDVYKDLLLSQEESSVKCKVGMATSAALFRIEAHKDKEVRVDIPLCKADSKLITSDKTIKQEWNDELSPSSRLKAGDKNIQFLYDAAMRTLLLHAQNEVYAGPYTYKRFWFRDAVIIAYALLSAGQFQKTEKIIDSFMGRQKANGYFCSQNGEWDSNGQVLWLINEFCKITSCPPKKEWLKHIDRGATWINKKLTKGDTNSLTGGLLPPGFSAEHLGPNDYYYWDDFWAAAGLKSASELMKISGSKDKAESFNKSALRLMDSIEKSLASAKERLKRDAMPASVYRRLDSGAIGSIVAGYPLKLFSASDKKIQDTVNYLIDNCLVKGGFFHNMSHSGINAYLTLHIAQVLLRAGDMRFFELMKTIKNLATSTGQWPEAIHPVTKGGCMGDGQHVWAASEWILMVRNCLIREDDNKLILCSGITEEWRNSRDNIYFEKVPTEFGSVSLKMEFNKNEITVSYSAKWHQKTPKVEICLPGFKAVRLMENQNSYTFRESN